MFKTILERDAFAAVIPLASNGTIQPAFYEANADKIAAAIGGKLSDGDTLEKSRIDATVSHIAVSKPKSTAMGGVAKKLKWAEFPAERLDDATGELYLSYREANKTAAECRKALLEKLTPAVKAAVVKAANKPLPAGKDVIVTLNYGKINVAVGDASDVASQSAKSLGDLF